MFLCDRWANSYLEYDYDHLIYCNVKLHTWPNLLHLLSHVETMWPWLFLVKKNTEHRKSCNKYKHRWWEWSKYNNEIHCCHQTLNVCLHYLVNHCICFRLSLFSDINVSQGSVATLVRCYGIFNDDFIANLLISLLMRELWTSVSSYRSYGQKYSSAIFFLDTVYNI